MGLLTNSKKPAFKSEIFTQQELQFLLKTLANARFDGRDVLLLSEIVQKLSNSLKSE